MNCEQRGLEIADQRAMTHSAGYPPSLRSRRSRRCGTCEGSASRITRDGSLHRASSSLVKAISLKASKLWQIRSTELMKPGVIRLDIFRALFKGGPEGLCRPVAVAAAKHYAPTASNRATLERMLEDACKSIGGGGVYCYWLNAAQ